MRRAARSGEDGFALVAALNAALLLSLLAYVVLAADRGAIASLDGDLRRARLEAASDAGVAMALAALGAPLNHRWPIDGRVQHLAVDGATLDVVVEDERSKVSIGDLRADTARRLFRAGGASGARLDQLTDGLLNWQDGGVRPDGGNDLAYAQAGLRQRGGPVRTVDELMALQGMDQPLFDRIAPALTVFPGRGPFDPDTASPLATEVLRSVGADAGKRKPAVTSDFDDYAGRPFTLRIVARDNAGGELRRSVIVELTGRKDRPYWTRAIE